MPALNAFDDAFAQQDVLSGDDILTADGDMRHYLRSTIAAQLRREGKVRGLVAALENGAQLKLDYDATVTRTAAEAFAARRGNCLALTLMTASLARELGLTVRFRKVIAHSTWVRESGLLISASHVNVAIEEESVPGRYSAGNGLIIDFLPGAVLVGQRAVEITERQVVAMFMNNRAVEALTTGNIDLAYAWIRAALREHPSMSESRVTLAAILLRRQMAGQALAVLDSALSREPDSVTALANAIVANEQLGRTEQVRILRERLVRLEAVPPFHYFDQAVLAMRSGAFAQAAGLFREELKRNADYAPAMYGLAAAGIQLGEFSDAARWLESAHKHAATESDRNIYAAKSAWLANQTQSTAPGQGFRLPHGS